jgi:hypothetical protein
MLANSPCDRRCWVLDRVFSNNAHRVLQEILPKTSQIEGVHSYTKRFLSAATEPVDSPKP